MLDDQRLNQILKPVSAHANWLEASASLHNPPDRLTLTSRLERRSFSAKERIPRWRLQSMRLYGPSFLRRATK
jgi:hypothetical protein